MVESLCRAEIEAGDFVMSDGRKWMVKEIYYDTYAGKLTIQPLLHQIFSPPWTSTLILSTQDISKPMI